jgi:hypothetical protein
MKLMRHRRSKELYAVKFVKRGAGMAFPRAASCSSPMSPSYSRKRLPCMRMQCQSSSMAEGAKLSSLSCVSHDDCLCES